MSTAPVPSQSATESACITARFVASSRAASLGCRGLSGVFAVVQSVTESTCVADRFSASSSAASLGSLGLSGVDAGVLPSAFDVWLSRTASFGSRLQTGVRSALPEKLFCEKR